MDNAQTVTDAKAAFIRAQVRLLSAVLQPSSHWRDSAQDSEQGPLSEKVVQDAVKKVNEKIQQHNRMVYSAQSQRHVAEQIDALYTNAVSQDDFSIDEDAVAVARDLDLHSSDAILSLPEDYADLHLHPDHRIDDASSTKYNELYERLAALSKRRDEQQQRLQQYRQLKQLLKPFENASHTVQPNLVTKDGELARELDRMRILLARVTGRIAEMEPSNAAGKRPAPQHRAVTSEEKLADVMDLT